MLSTALKILSAGLRFTGFVLYVLWMLYMVLQVATYGLKNVESYNLTFLAVALAIMAFGYFLRRESKDGTESKIMHIIMQILTYLGFGVSGLILLFCVYFLMNPIGDEGGGALLIILVIFGIPSLACFVFTAFLIYTRNISGSEEMRKVSKRLAIGITGLLLLLVMLFIVGGMLKNRDKSHQSQTLDTEELDNTVEDEQIETEQTTTEQVTEQVNTNPVCDEFSYLKNNANNKAACYDYDSKAILVIDLATGEKNQLMSVYETTDGISFAWAPDDSKLAIVVVNQNDDSYRQTFGTKLFMFNLNSDGEVEQKDTYLYKIKYGCHDAGCNAVSGEDFHFENNDTFVYYTWDVDPYSSGYTDEYKRTLDLTGIL